MRNNQQKDKNFIKEEKNHIKKKNIEQIDIPTRK